MAFLTTAYALATDICAGIAHLERQFGEHGEVVLAGHSSGGGLVQIVCDQELARVHALALLAGTPSFGG
jgi:pimeloyl-ACP methyl ester carboxylesterase